jgi:hypothetical protein
LGTDDEPAENERRSSDGETPASDRSLIAPGGARATEDDGRGARNEPQTRDPYHRDGGELPHPVDARADGERKERGRQRGDGRALVARSPEPHERGCDPDSERAGEEEESEQAELAERLEIQRVGVSHEHRD